MRCRPRYSQMPASGSSAFAAARWPSDLEQMEQALVAGPRQPAIEEHRHGGEDDAAIGVVLHLLGGGVADPHRAVAAVAFQLGRDALVDDRRRHHAVERAKLLVGLRRDRQRERDELFHGARGADAVERLDDEISIAQPAIAVVPGAAAMRRLWNRRGVRGDDAAGLVEIGEFQRNGGADDRLLPIVGDRQPAHPLHPIVMGAFEKIAAGFLQVAGEWLVGTEYHVQRPRQHERRFAVDHRQRGVGGQTNGGAVAGVADMVAAERTVWNWLAVIVSRPHAHSDAWQAGQRLDDAK